MKKQTCFNIDKLQTSLNIDKLTGKLLIEEKKTSLTVVEKRKRSEVEVEIENEKVLFDDLPHEIFFMILNFLSPHTIFIMEMTYYKWYQIIKGYKWLSSWNYREQKCLHILQFGLKREAILYGLRFIPPSSKTFPVIFMPADNNLLELMKNLRYFRSTNCNNNLLLFIKKFIFAGKCNVDMRNLYAFVRECIIIINIYSIREKLITIDDLHALFQFKLIQLINNYRCTCLTFYSKKYVTILRC